MWRELKWALRDIDPTSFLFGFGYGMFTLAAIVLFAYICNWVCENSQTQSVKPKNVKKKR
jgi:hypothetical protein